MIFFYNTGYYYVIVYSARVGSCARVLQVLACARIKMAASKGNVPIVICVLVTSSLSFRTCPWVDCAGTTYPGFCCAEEWWPELVWCVSCVCEKGMIVCYIAGCRSAELWSLLWKMQDLQITSHRRHVKALKYSFHVYIYIWFCALLELCIAVFCHAGQGKTPQVRFYAHVYPRHSTEHAMYSSVLFRRKRSSDGTPESGK